MRFSFWRTLLLGICLLRPVPGGAADQAQWPDSILPPDHLLENLPWMGEEGKVESKGLFDFEDIRGTGQAQKDLILIYRQSVPATELDKPHNQTLIVGFYDLKLQKYVKQFEDEGGTIQWVKFLEVPGQKGLRLVLQRDDLKGNQVLKGFAYLNGAMKPVLDAMAPQIFAKFQAGSQGPEIWCSSKEMPRDKNSAEHLFAWDPAKSNYAEGKSLSTAGWTGTSIAIPVTVAARKAVEPAATAVPQAKPRPIAKGGWWTEPLDAQAAILQLKTELVPSLIQKGDIAGLGQKAKTFFAELQKKGTTPAEVSKIKSTYYSAVASAVLGKGDAKGAAYYLKLALQLQPDNPDALALKEKINK